MKWRLVTLLLLGSLALDGRGQGMLDAEIVDRQLSRLTNISISVSFFSEEENRFSSNWSGTRTRTRYGSEGYIYSAMDDGDAREFIRDRAHDIVYDLMVEHGFDVVGRHVRVSISGEYIDVRVTPVGREFDRISSPSLLYNREGIIADVVDEQAVLDRTVFPLPRIELEHMLLSMYAPLVESVAVVHAVAGEDVATDMAFVRRRYGFIGMHEVDLVAAIGDDVAGGRLQFTFADGLVREHVLSAASFYNELFTPWPARHVYTVEPDATAWTVITRNAIPGADYTFWWKSSPEAPPRVLASLTADAHGEMQIGGIFGGFLEIGSPAPDALGSISLTDVFGSQADLAPEEYRHTMVDLVNRINALNITRPFGEPEPRLVPSSMRDSMTDSLTVLDDHGLDAFGFTLAELGSILDAFTKIEIEYRRFPELTEVDVHEQLLVRTGRPFPPPLQILGYLSGFSWGARGNAILELVSRGSDGLTSDEKRTVMRALSGDKVNQYGFSDAQIDRIYETINN